jgi:hypothetical protein
METPTAYDVLTGKSVVMIDIVAYGTLSTNPRYWLQGKSITDPTHKVTRFVKQEVAEAYGPIQLKTIT